MLFQESNHFPKTSSSGLLCRFNSYTMEKDGESGAAQLLAKLGGMGELTRDLAYRLYTTCERKKWAQEALAFNSLVVSWLEIVRPATPQPAQAQEEMF